MGSTVEAAARWLREKPDTVDLDSNHFAVLNNEAVNGIVLICKIGDQKLQDDALSIRWQSARHSSNFLNGMEPGE
jgi:hypothetical protein